MARLFAQRILSGQLTFENVPSKLRISVAEILLSENQAELVPIDYGGTLVL